MASGNQCAGSVHDGLQPPVDRAARNNLDLVADTYTQGRVSLVDLIDAQTNALNADLGAADAVNDYLLDLMRVERAMGQFMFFVSAEDREVWIQELEQFASQRR